MRVALAVGAGVAALWGALVMAGDRALATGRDLYAHRARLLGRLGAPRPDGRLVVWLGDSTFFPPSYPHRVATALEPLGVRSRVVADFGLDPFALYYLMGGVLALEPDLVVLVANLRQLDVQVRSRRTWVDLSSLVPTAELPYAVTLPIAASGASIPQLLLARVLRVPVVEAWFLRVEGLRSLMTVRSRPPPVPQPSDDDALPDPDARTTPAARVQAELATGRRAALTRFAQRRMTGPASRCSRRPCGWPARMASRRSSSSRRSRGIRCERRGSPM